MNCQSEKGIMQAFDFLVAIALMPSQESVPTALPFRVSFGKGPSMLSSGSPREG